MQRFVNDPDYIVEDMVKGFVKAYDDLIVRSENNDRVVKYKDAPVEGKVGLVTGGGSGHEPAFLGYVGKNMMDAVAVGEIFLLHRHRPFMMHLWKQMREKVLPVFLVIMLVII